MFLKIATHLSYKPNFVNYMFRDDMISDGIENCIQYIHNFDLKNPRILLLLYADHSLCVSPQDPKEKKQLEIKTKIIERTGFDEVMMVDDNFFLVVVQTIMLSKIIFNIRLIDEGCYYHRPALWC